LLNGGHQDNQLEEAVLGIIAAMDKSSSPAGEARQAFYNHLFGRSIEQRMAFRQRVLATTMEDLQRAASTYFQQGHESIGIVSNRQALEEAKIDGLNILNI
jgi:Zn-dependent M16 (insulinase) family peptidase